MNNNKIEDNIDSIIIPPPLKTNLPINKRLNEMQSTKSTPRSPKNNRLINSNTTTPHQHINESIISSATPIDYKRKELTSSSNTPRSGIGSKTSSNNIQINLPPRPTTNILDRLTRPTVSSNMQKKPKVGLFRTDSMSKLEGRSSNSNTNAGACNSSNGVVRHSKTSSDIIELPKISSARTERKLIRRSSKQSIQFSGEDEKS